MFKWNDIEFQFENVSYIIDDKVEFAETFQRLSEKFLVTINEDNKLDNHVKFINELLKDDNAVNDIFNGRKVTVDRCLQIVKYIMEVMQRVADNGKA